MGAIWLGGVSGYERYEYNLCSKTKTAKQKGLTILHSYFVMLFTEDLSPKSCGDIYGRPQDVDRRSEEAPQNPRTKGKICRND